MKYLWLIILVTSALCGSAQDVNPDELKPGLLKNFGANAERLHDIYGAINYYKAYIKKKPKDFKAIYHLAELEERTRNYSQALLYYNTAYESNPNKFSAALYHKARMEKMMGSYDLAKKDFQKFIAEQGEGGKDDLKSRASIELLSCDTAIMFRSRPLPFAINNLGAGINKQHIEFAPVPTSANDIIYGSLPEPKPKSYDLDEPKPKRKFYKGRRVGQEWQGLGELEGPFNSNEAHTGNGAFSPDGTRFYFSRCSEDWNMDVTCELWLSVKKDHQWSEPEKLNSDINKSGYSSSQPSVGRDENSGKEVLYFVSDRPGGFGGTDIWYTLYDSTNKSYSVVKNVGTQINTNSNEMTPYYYEPQKKLFYSTDGRAGLGGYDVFVARGAMKTWLSASNVGYPINSSADDIYYVLSPLAKSGFLVSNRIGGQQYLHETCCDDIYEFYEYNPIRIVIECVAVETDGQQYFNGKSDDMKEADELMLIERARINVYLVEDNSEVFMRVLETDENGEFVMDLEPDKNYRFEMKKSGFLNNDIEVSTIGMDQSQTIHRVAGMGRMTEGTYVVENIEYEFDSAKLTNEAREKIDNSLLKVLNENPQIKIELGSHTDSRGTDEYNQKLSQQRAESVIRYLTSKGIGIGRLVAKGYGESVPIAANENKDGSDNPEGRQKNRRTEFKIIGVVNVPKVWVED